MKKKVFLDSIVPYNDTFYKFCFYNSFLSLLSKYKIDVLSFLVKDFSVYVNGSSNKNENYFVEYFERDEFLELCKEVGLQVRTKEHVADIVTEVKKSIDAGRPVIVRVDSYFQESRQDMYKKLHWPHSLLICGYDEENRTFNIIDHDKREVLDFYHKEVSYKEIEESFNYFQNHMNDPDVPLFSDYEMDSTLDRHIDFHKEYSKTLNLYRAEAVDRLGHLESFQKFIFDWFDENRENRISQFEEVLFTVNNVIHVKDADEYKYKLLRYDRNESILNEIIDLYKKLRFILIRSRSKAEIDVSNKVKISKWFAEIKALEYKLLTND